MVNRTRRITNYDIIRDLVNHLTEDQIHDYITNQNQNYHIPPQTINKLTESIENEKHGSTPERLENIREHFIDYLYETTIPSGLSFQHQVAEWLKRKDSDLEENEHIRGALTYPKYIDVDIHVKKQRRLWSKQVWVEVKVPQVTLPIVQKILRNATTVHQARAEGKVEWAPDLLMLVSARGFTKPALALADSHKVYCVQYRIGFSPQSRGRRYHFVGLMSEENYDRGINSEYPKHPSTTL